MFTCTVFTVAKAEVMRSEREDGEGAGVGGEEGGEDMFLSVMSAQGFSKENDVALGVVCACAKSLAWACWRNWAFTMLWCLESFCRPMELFSRNLTAAMTSFIFSFDPPLSGWCLRAIARIPWRMSVHSQSEEDTSTMRSDQLSQNFGKFSKIFENRFSGFLAVLAEKSTQGPP